ncbi:MAG: glycoside hydrolase family 30 beta sandwich domain-containing protein [Candidatus Izemoplasmatales bacterium]
MKRLIIAGLLLLTSLSLFACENNTTSDTLTSITTTTTTTSETTTSTTSIDVSQTEVFGYTSNTAGLFSDIEYISDWDKGALTSTFINVDDFQTFQTFYGTGAALTYSSAYVINQSPDRDEIINYLFSESGLHIQLVRLTVGASDFVPSSVGHYTYDDSPNNTADMELNYFSLEQDQIIFDIIEQALEINPDIVFLAAPWSAPAWMKTNKNLYGGALSTIYYNSYANYLIRYLQEMENMGIHIKYLSIQNEPYYAPYDYPGMTWTIDTTKIFIRDFLGPKLVENGLTTSIMIWDHNPVDNNGNLIDYPVRVLNNEETASYVGAIGVHCYTGDDADMYDFLDYLHENNPEMEVFMTECTAVTTYKNLSQNMEWSLRRMYLETYNRFASGTTYWNMVLDPVGSVHDGGCSNCTGLLSVPIDGSSGYTVEADAYVTGHFSKDIMSGATRIYTKANNTGLLVTGFKDQNGKITLVIFNDSVARTTTINWRNHSFAIALPQSSLTTVYWTVEEE